MTDPQLENLLKQAIDRLHRDLSLEKGTASHWTGELSTSALSTATAVSALSVCLERMSARKKADANQDLSPDADAGAGAGANTGTGRQLPDDSLAISQMGSLIENGSRWLAKSQNKDGGFGDTDRSLSNIATTLLVLAAWQLAGHNARHSNQINAAWAYVASNGGWDGLRQRYGKDKTFVVPIMTNCAIAGLVDWGQIPTLPFEAAALPQSWYRFAQMPVVSYAIPALVAIGQAQFYHQRNWNPITRFIRSLCIEPTRRVLMQMQPTSGGYLEAVPLTSFVLMSLASIDQMDLRVAREARKFLLNSVLPDGSWPIDTNLATWVTSLTLPVFFGNENAASTDHRETDQIKPEPCVLDRTFALDRTIDWLLSCQHVRRHPFTGADPGGWGWTNLSGAVPDADDTPAALLALKHWFDSRSDSDHTADAGIPIFAEMRMERVIKAAAMGCRWLLKLQNRDGGWPTFCRGWGTLPFDRSGSDLTAHAIRALTAWRTILCKQEPGFSVRPINSAKLNQAIDLGWTYLQKNQLADGSWLPLWFGNQDRPEEDNPIYGTGRVLKCFADCGRSESSEFKRGVDFLLRSQNPDGGWGGGNSIHYPSRQELSCANDKVGRSSTIEETAIALEGIMCRIDTTHHSDSIMMGLSRLSEFILAGDHYASQPIGFYFAKLWYHERLYPMVFSLSALKKGLEICQR